MKTLLAALAFSLCCISSAPAASPDCGKYPGMTCAPADKNAKYTSGVTASDCGKYPGMTCAPMPKATAAAATSAKMKTGRSVNKQPRRQH